MPSFATVDFETDGIARRPDYPPVPCGVALKYGHTKKYLAWRHESENNCTRARAIRELKKIWHSHSLIFHNAAFDIEVAMKHFGLSWPKQEFHDTLILAYLHDPRDQDMGLKPLADKYLDMPPDEQEELKQWILDNIPEARRKPSSWGAYIQKAPGKLVGKYAVGDVDRTWKLFKLFYAHIKHPVDGDKRNMLAPYARERRLLKTKIAMEQGGIRGNTKKIKRELPAYKNTLKDVEKEIRKKLKITKAWEEENCKDEIFNVNSGPQLAKAIEHAGLVDEWILTPKGNPSTSRDNLEKSVKDAKLVELLGLQGILTNYIGTFLSPWLLSCEANDGYIYPSFNTVRSTNEYGKGGYGTTTGRLSSSNPNFQNIPASVKGSVHEVILRKLQALLKKRKVNLIGLRDYLIPDEGCTFIVRDYSQQEFRIFAHYEDGEVMQQYLDDPKIDFHTAVQQLVLAATGVNYPRKAIKNINFGLLYGMGIGLLARNIGCSLEEATQLKRTVLSLVSGIKDLSDDLKSMARRKQPLITSGGRYYYCEPSKYIGKEWKSFDYKMLNLLIQGSAADCTKEAMIKTEDAFDTGRLVLQVHDELVASVPIKDAEREMRSMRDAMESVKFDVPLLTEGKWGLKGESWARLYSSPF